MDASFLLYLILSLIYLPLEALEKIKKRYYDLIPRSFNTKLELYTFWRCCTRKEVGSFTFSEFRWFSITDEIIELHLKAWNLTGNEKLSLDGLTMSEIDNQIESWSLNNQKIKEKLFDNYRLYFITELFPFSEFEKIYSSDPQNRVCHYCKINDKDLEEMESYGQIRTKRSRGFSMEVDRLNSNREYRADNIVLSCYWCNNAKSDEFTEPEFHDFIGPGISKIWDQRRLRYRQDK